MNIISRLFPVLILLTVTNAADLVNITVDDAGPDPLTRQYISYYPDGAWTYGPSCSDCTARPDTTQVYQSTWHDNSLIPSVSGAQVAYAEFNFTGVAVYVYCILSNSKDFPPGNNDMSFYVDGELADTFVREADGSPGYIYNFPVFAHSSLSFGEHRLVIQNGHEGGTQALALLDKIIYTQNQNGEVNRDGNGQGGNQQNGKGTSKLGAILGGILGGLGGLVLIGFGWLFWRRRNNNNQNASREWPSDLVQHSLYPFPPVHESPSVYPPLYRKRDPSREVTIAGM